MKEGATKTEPRRKKEWVPKVAKESGNMNNVKDNRSDSSNSSSRSSGSLPAKADTSKRVVEDEMYARTKISQARYTHALKCSKMLSINCTAIQSRTQA